MIQILKEAAKNGKYEDVRELLESTGASDYARNKALRLLEKTKESLKAFPEGEARNSLVALADCSAYRCC